MQNVCKDTMMAFSTQTHDTVDNFRHFEQSYASSIKKKDKRAVGRRCRCVHISSIAARSQKNVAQCSLLTEKIHLKLPYEDMFSDSFLSRNTHVCHVVSASRSRSHLRVADTEMRELSNGQKKRQKISHIISNKPRH